MRTRLLPAALVAAVACSSPATELTYYEPHDPRTLDPARATDVASGEMVTLLYEGLTRFTPSGEMEAGLASGWAKILEELPSAY